MQELAKTALHPSSEVSLKALEWLYEQTYFKNILDVGCGNGLLSIISAQIWQANVLAVDISQNAVSDAKTAVLNNKVSDKVIVAHSDRFAHPLVRSHAPYDLIIANMLDQWLMEMATQVKNHIIPGGYAILSGMLAWLAADTKRSYTQLGFEIIAEFSASPWECCIIRCPG